jgi:hypothetical protein
MKLKSHGFVKAENSVMIKILKATISTLRIKINCFILITQKYNSVLNCVGESTPIRKTNKENTFQMIPIS